MPSPPSQLEADALWQILEVSRRLSIPTDLDTTLEQVINVARQVLTADRGTVFLHDAATDELYTQVAHGVEGVRIPATRGIAGECAQTRRMINVPDCYADFRFNQEVDKRTGYRTLCLLAVPLIGDQEELVGVLQVLNKSSGTFDEGDERLASVLGAQCAVAIQRAKLIQDRLMRQKLESDMAIAREIQKGGLPKTIPQLPGYDITGWSEPAEETGGDIYDVVAMDEHRIMLLMADATGHGIGPALSVMQARAMVRMALRMGGDLDGMLCHTNDQLREDLADNRFITAFMGILDTQTHTLNYHAPGQGPLLHYQAATGKCVSLDASTFPLAVVGGISPTPPPPIAMAPGDIFALISDGIFECPNAQKDRFGTPRVEQIIHDHRADSMNELLEALRSAVNDFAAGTPQADDMTALLVKREGTEDALDPP